MCYRGSLFAGSSFNFLCLYMQGVWCSGPFCIYFRFSENLVGLARLQAWQWNGVAANLIY